MTNEAKLGGFVLIGIVALIVSIMLLGDFQFQSKYYLNIMFHDIAGLPSKSRVKIAGVEVGGVKKIALEGNKAKVTVWLSKSIRVHKDAVARIVSTGIIGSKYLELTMGNEELPLLKDGDVVTGIDPVSMDKVINDLMEQLDAFVAPFKGKGMKNIGENLSVTLENLKKVSDTLKNTIAGQEDRINNIVRNVDNFTKDLAEITAENKENIRIAIEEVRNVSQKLNTILVKVQKGEGTIGKLLSDEEMGENLKQTVQEIKETAEQAKAVVKRLNVIHTDWDYMVRYDANQNITRHDFGLRISPKPDKFYFLGVSNVGDSKDSTDTIEEQNTFNFLLGKKYDMAELYVGAIRSKAGFGMKIKPLWKWEPWRRLEVTADVYHLSRKTPVTKANINTGLRVQLAKWLYVGSQVEDIYYQSDINTYANVVIRDDDIAYILGLVGLARP
ncbi:MAG: MlaD family protein [Elusimicrobia bacterium]|nr:MlaD family protein [Elusimicrobiota bacterium]